MKLETGESKKRKLKLEEIVNVKKRKLALQDTIESVNWKVPCRSWREKRFHNTIKPYACRNSVKDKQQTLTDLTNAQKKLEEKLKTA